jgi:hypothetical protein
MTAAMGWSEDGYILTLLPSNLKTIILLLTPSTGLIKTLRVLIFSHPALENAV